MQHVRFVKGRGTCDSGERNVKIWIDFRKSPRFSLTSPLSQLREKSSRPVFTVCGEPCSPYFALGTRKYNIFHCQLRNLASNLNQHLSDSSRCPCGDDVEDNFHYFYVCPLFICQRILLFTQLRDLADFLNIDVLLKGSSDLSFDNNVLIMNSVHTYICGTKRLDY